MGVATTVALLRSASRIALRGSELAVNFFWPAIAVVNLGRLASITARRSKASFGIAPALELKTADGQRATIRLGWWRREPELLAILADSVRRSGATLDGHVASILRDRPPGEWWSLEQQQTREAAKRPPTRLERLLGRVPAPLRFLLQMGLYVLAIVAMYAVFEGMDRLSENVLFPRHIDPAWSTQVVLPPNPGDSWVGNVATDGGRIYLAARQTVEGFWGTIWVWRSSDGGLSWSPPVVASRHPWPDAARHALAVAPDGSLWLAFAEQGARPATQRLVVRVSHDHGVSWTDGAAVSPARVGLIGLPVFLLTGDARLVAYTDGQTGDVLAQRLTAAGTPDGAPAVLGQTARELYSDANFLDGAVALASADGRISAVWVEGTRTLRASVSRDGGVSWTASNGLDQELYGGRPRMATDGSTILLAATDPNRGARYVRHPHARIWRSTDGGLTFSGAADVTDVEDIGSLELIWAKSRWRLVYDACPGFITCATPPRIWYTESTNGDQWSDATVLSDIGNVQTLGLVDSNFGLAAVWGIEASPHNWAFHLARRSP